MVNFTCNSTLDDLRIGRSEVPITAGLTFHGLATLIGGACTVVAVVTSLFLIGMHASHYTKPSEQRHVIRILFMVPVYAIASFLSILYYWYEVYFEVISECYEAFAIASFFALLCHYIAPTVHDQKDYFRGITPKRWVWPMNWVAKPFGDQNGPFRTPRSGLTWFNVIWFGIYQYCFIRVAMTVTAVVTQYFGRYCESSDSPLFAHVWILVIESIAVSVAMYCVIQFYVQTKHDLAEKQPFLKVVAIKLVIFLSFWQSVLLSVLTSQSLGPVISTTEYVAYPDLMVGIPNLLLCIEMMIFAFLHLFAFPWQPYRTTGVRIDPGLKEVGKSQGGFLGLKAIGDAMNPWDLVKAFARGTRWFFVGRKTRQNDISYKANPNDVPLNGADTAYKGSNANLPIADEFRKSNFGMNFPKVADDPEARGSQTSESLGLIQNAQPSPSTSPLPQFARSAYTPARQRYDANGYDIVQEDRLKTLQPGPRFQPYLQREQVQSYSGEIGTAYGGHENEQTWPQPQQYQHQSTSRPQYNRYDSKDEMGGPYHYHQDSQDSTASLQQMQPSHQSAATHQQAAHAMLWGPQAKEERGI